VISWYIFWFVLVFLSGIGLPVGHSDPFMVGDATGKVLEEIHLEWIEKVAVFRRCGSKEGMRKE